MAPYTSFKDLRLNEVDGVDYRIRSRPGSTGILIMAPHGGNIEPGTSQIADAIAGDAHAFYAFEGLKKGRNSNLHITSRCFDEPVGSRMAGEADTVLTFHGCNNAESVVFVGGLDLGMSKRVWKALERGGFTLKESPRIPGKHPDNICNRGRSGMGVQLEISSGLRKQMFIYQPEHEPEQTDVFHRFVGVMRSGLSEDQ